MVAEDLANINILGFAFGLILGGLTLLLPRRFAYIPFLVSASSITIGQRIDLLGINFHMMRILILFGWLRLYLRGEIQSLEWNRIDKAVLWWALVGVLTYTIRLGTFDGLISALGPAYNALGAYFFFRLLIRDWQDVRRIVLTISIIFIPLAILMAIENHTGRNLFSIFGGVPEITMIREGRLRCQGPFRHPILTGTFAATSIPLIIGLLMSPLNKKKTLIWIGLVGAFVVTMLSASSGPLMTLSAAILGLILWKFRQRTRLMFWGIILGIAFLHFVIMKSPVWFLIGRLGNVIGGTGWHRSVLIDEAVKHFHEWWLLGTSYTAHWAKDWPLMILPWEPNMIDITNQFIFIGVNGGMVPLLLFILILYRCFNGIGQLFRLSTEIPIWRKFLYWCMGVALLSHVVSFLSVAYFDQIIVFWWSLVAMISQTLNLNSIEQNGLPRPSK